MPALTATTAPVVQCSYLEILRTVLIFRWAGSATNSSALYRPFRASA